MNNTPEWAVGLSTATEITARQMVSVLRWRDRDDPLYVGEMKRLCRMIEAHQLQQQKDTCHQQQTQPSPEDASHSTVAANGAPSGDTSGGSVKSSAPAGPTAASASARTTTSASAPVAKRLSAAKPAARPSVTLKDAHAKTAAAKPDRALRMARRIVSRLVQDLTGRPNFSDVWMSLDPAFCLSMIHLWESIVAGELSRKIASPRMTQE